jgi:carbonic anhydrase/acetyltransferase-like protein (isoleucine patch superfamily)
VSASAAVAGHSTVGANGLLGIGAIVIDNIAIEPGVIVGAGAVVTQAAKSGEKLVGVPAHNAPALRRFGPTPR